MYCSEHSSSRSLKKYTLLKKKKERKKITVIIGMSQSFQYSRLIFSSPSPVYLLPSALGQVLLGGQRADGADPRFSHAFDPQHHPAELLPLWHHPVELLEAGAHLRLHQYTHRERKRERGGMQEWLLKVSVTSLCTIDKRTVCSFIWALDNENGTLCNLNILWHYVQLIISLPHFIICVFVSSSFIFFFFCCCCSVIPWRSLKTLSDQFSTAIIKMPKGSFSCLQ